MNKTFSLLFYIRKDKMISDTAPIYLRITIDGKKVELSTKRFIKPSDWNGKSQKVTGTNDESKSINSFLKTFELNVYQSYKELMLIKSEISAIDLKNKLYGIGKKAKLLLEVFEDHNKKFAALVGDKEDNYAPLIITESYLEIASNH